MKKFTLLELLIVIAVIGLLLTLLLPSLGKARNKAKDAVCLSNQRQIGLLVYTYTVTHNKMLPNHRIGGKSYIEFIQEEPDPGIYTCPRNPVWTYSDGSTIEAKAETAAERLHLTSYGYNGWWLGLAEYRTGTQGQPMGRNFMFLMDSANPSNLLVTADTKPIKSVRRVGRRRVNGYWWGCSIWYPNRKHNTFDKVEGAFAAHGNKDQMSAVLYLDGHVGYENANAINYDTEHNTKWNPDIERWSTPHD